jgi:hypothetical protein
MAYGRRKDTARRDPFYAASRRTEAELVEAIAEEEVRAKMAKTRGGKKKVHVPAHTRIVRTKNGRRRKRISEHYRLTPE